MICPNYSGLVLLHLLTCHLTEHGNLQLLNKIWSLLHFDSKISQTVEFSGSAFLIEKVFAYFTSFVNNVTKCAKNTAEFSLVGASSIKTFKYFCAYYRLPDMRSKKVASDSYLNVSTSLVKVFANARGVIILSFFEIITILKRHVFEQGTTDSVTYSGFFIPTVSEELLNFSERDTYSHV